MNKTDRKKDRQKDRQTDSNMGRQMHMYNSITLTEKYRRAGMRNLLIQDRQKTTITTYTINTYTYDTLVNTSTTTITTIRKQLILIFCSSPNVQTVKGDITLQKGDG